MANQVNNYVPYIYINQQETNGYDLYILVPVEAGKTVLFPLEYNSGLTASTERGIRGIVINGSQNIIEVNGKRFVKQYYSLPELENVEKITIFVENGNVSNHKNTYRLTDADIFDTDIRHENMAMNCPYLYLMHDYNTFHPRLLVPLQGTTFSSENETVTLEKGVSSIVIDLQGGTSQRAVNIISPVKTNEEEYYSEEINVVECEVNVQNSEIPGIADKKRKGKKRRADSDSQ